MSEEGEDFEVPDEELDSDALAERRELQAIAARYYVLNADLPPVKAPSGYKLLWKRGVNKAGFCTSAAVFIAEKPTPFSGTVRAAHAHAGFGYLYVERPDGEWAVRVPVPLALRSRPGDAYEGQVQRTLVEFLIEGRTAHQVR